MHLLYFETDLFKRKKFVSILRRDFVQAHSGTGWNTGAGQSPPGAGADIFSCWFLDFLLCVFVIFDLAGTFLLCKPQTTLWFADVCFYFYCGGKCSLSGLFHVRFTYRSCLWLYSFHPPHRKAEDFVQASTSASTKWCGVVRRTSSRRPRPHPQSGAVWCGGHRLCRTSSTWALSWWCRDFIQAGESNLFFTWFSTRQNFLHSPVPTCTTWLSPGFVPGKNFCFHFQVFKVKKLFSFTCFWNQVKNFWLTPGLGQGKTFSPFFFSIQVKTFSIQFTLSTGKLFSPGLVPNKTYCIHLLKPGENNLHSPVPTGTTWLSPVLIPGKTFHFESEKFYLTFSKWKPFCFRLFWKSEIKLFQSETFLFSPVFKKGTFFQNKWRLFCTAFFFFSGHLYLKRGSPISIQVQPLLHRKADTCNRWKPFCTAKRTLGLNEHLFHLSRGGKIKKYFSMTRFVLTEQKIQHPFEILLSCEVLPQYLCWKKWHSKESFHIYT